MKTKHTPGPWVMYQTPNDIDFVAEIEGIASIYAASGDALANARLIAAAPELLDAADNALNTLIACCVSAGGVDDRRAILEAQQMLRSAIAKATGQEF